jgi:plasmid stabilization system protein ParE
MARLTLSRRAALDLIEIERYSIEQWGKKTAAGYLLEIEEALRLLKDHPGLLREKTEVSENLKFYRVGRHFLVCAVEVENIYVLTVKHGAMDLPERIREIEPALIHEAEILHRAFIKSLGP